MSTLLQDLRFGVRALLRNPLFTAIGAFTLALGIGLNTAVFSAVDALLLRPLPGARAPEELRQVYRTLPGGMNYGSSSAPHFLGVRERSQDVFGDVAAWSYAPINLSFGGKNARVFSIVASANFFRTLGVTMARGRAFAPEEDVGEGAHPVAILSYSTWQRTFGGDPSIVGRSVVLNGHAYGVVGIASAEFHGVLPLISPALYAPLMQLRDVFPSDTSVLHNRATSFLSIIARLKPSVNAAQATDRLQAVNREFAKVFPNDYKGSGIFDR